MQSKIKNSEDDILQFWEGRTILGYIRQHIIFRDLVRKNPFLENLLKMYYCLILILWNIFLTVPLVEISAHSELNLTSPRIYIDNVIVFFEWTKSPTTFNKVKKKFICLNSENTGTGRLCCGECKSGIYKFVLNLLNDVKQALRTGNLVHPRLSKY